MKSKLKSPYKILTLVLIIFVAFIAVSCSVPIELAEPKVETVAVYSLSKVDGYVAGDNIDLYGAKILVVYDNGDSEILDLTQEMIDYSQLDMSEPEDEKIVTVVYGGAKTTFTISVAKWDFEKVELTKLPNKTTYIEGESVDPNGAVLSLYYAGGNVKSQEVTKYMLESYAKTVGKREIKIKFFGAENLVFEVEFLKQTAKEIQLLREPAQKEVFLGYGGLLSRDDMYIKIIYDNLVAEEYENALSSRHDIETVAKKRAQWKDNIEDNLFIYIDDKTVTGKTDAKVAYKEPSLQEEIEYKFNGVAHVKVGDIVDISTIIATTNYKEDIKSKSEGIVTEVTSSGITISRNITYQCNNPYFKEGDVVVKEKDIIGQQALSNVTATVSGIITAIGGGEITIMAVPVLVFDIAVVYRQYKSMEIIKEPITVVHKTSIHNIIQGDTIDLTEGKVRVTFNNGETAEYFMSNSPIIEVKNGSTNLRKEIPGLSFTGVGNVADVPAGENYELKYDFKFDDGYTYSQEELKTVVSVLDKSGNINVSNNRIIVPQAETNYTVSITVTYTTPQGEKLVSEASYIVSTRGAKSEADRLDIRAAGKHTLIISYGADDNNSIEMDVEVEQKVATRIIIDSETNNIGQHTFYRGDALSFSVITYRLEYSNGDIDEKSTGVTRNMVINKSEFIDENLICTEIGEEQFIEISIPNSSVQSQKLYFTVNPLPIVNLKIIKEPTDPFLIGKGITNGGTTGITAIDLSGASILVSYFKGTTASLNDDYLNTLFNNGKNDKIPNIKVAYNSIDEDELTEEEIFGEQRKHYIAVLTYTDEYGETSSTDIKYYIVAKKPKAIKVSAVQGSADWHYKSDYVQCEDWDLTGINVIVTYDGESGSTITETIPLKPYMIYDTDTNTIGNGQQLIVRYFGMLEEQPSLTFNVRERQETGVVIQKVGKIKYVNTGTGLDLSEYRFEINFNAGTSETVNGIFAFEGNPTKRGWWYEVYDAEISAGSTKPEAVIDNYGNLIRSSMRLIGYKMIRLAHTSEYELKDEQGNIKYNINYVDFYIEVDVSEAKISGIRFDNTSDYASGGTIPILCKVAVGSPLVYTYLDESILKTRYLTILYDDDTTGIIELTHPDIGIDYQSNNSTLGYRTVKINYDIFTCFVYVHVIDALLVDINLINVPKTDFINGEDFSIEGGILRATYKENGSDDTFSTYVLMSSETANLEYGEVDCIIDEYEENVYNYYDNKTITIEYGTQINKISTTYGITIYNKQDVEFSYSDVIFFYGNSSDATYLAIQQIDGFILPTEDDPRTKEDESDPEAIRKYYVSNEFFVYMTPEEYEIAKLTNTNLVPIVLGEKDNETIAYYDLDNVCMYNGLPSRPYVPVKSGYSYYILMMVSGNRYYRTRNYCFQEYTIIPKVIEVNVATANENAFVLRVFTNDNPTAVKGLYKDINSINGKWTNTYSYIQKIELASPNKDYFEVLMTVTSDYSDSYYAQIVAIFNEIRGQIGMYQTGGVKVIINDTKTTIIRGVNIAEYNGGQPDYITYTIASGETLTYYNILDLLEGKLQISVPKDSNDNEIFGIGNYPINNNSKTLHHNNYNIELVILSGTEFRVVKNKVIEMVVAGNANNDYLDINDGGLLTITQGDEIIANIIDENNNIRRVNDYEIKYYTNQECREEDLVTGELIAREEVYYAQLSDEYYLHYVDLEPDPGYQVYGFRFTVKVN